MIFPKGKIYSTTFSHSRLLRFKNCIFRIMAVSVYTLVQKLTIRRFVEIVIFRITKMIKLTVQNLLLLVYIFFSFWVWHESISQNLKCFGELSLVPLCWSCFCEIFHIEVHEIPDSFFGLVIGAYRVCKKMRSNVYIIHFISSYWVENNISEIILNSTKIQQAQ